MDGAKLIVIDPRLSNTAAMADHWLPTWPGSEPALFLAWAKMILERGLYDRQFMETQVNWDMWMSAVHPNESIDFEVESESLISVENIVLDTQQLKVFLPAFVYAFIGDITNDVAQNNTSTFFAYPDISKDRCVLFQTFLI